MLMETVKKGIATRLSYCSWRAAALHLLRGRMRYDIYNVEVFLPVSAYRVRHRYHMKSVCALLFIRRGYHHRLKTAPHFTQLTNFITENRVTRELHVV